MKTIYTSKKRVAREMTGSTHTLPILIEYAWSMARVCLEYGLSMARVWLEHAYTRHTEGLSPRASGLAIANYTIQPGETINTNIPVAGVYIIRAANGRIQKKIAIK